MVHTAHMQNAKPEFGPGVYAARLVRSTIKDADRLLDQAMEAGYFRVAGTGIATLDPWMRDHPHAKFIYGEIFAENANVTERLLRNCSDLAEGLALALDANGSVLTSLYVLQRALGEAVMRICYMFDAAVAPARTMARLAAYQIESVEGNLRAAEAFGRAGKESAGRTLSHIDMLHKMMKEGGFELHPDTRRPPLTFSVSIDGERENIKFDATAAFKKYVPASAWQWELGSGVTHSRGWMLASILPTLETEAPGSTVDSIMGVALTVFELADALAVTAAAHTGVNADWFRKRIHGRRRGALSWTESHDDLAVGHVEYSNRPANFIAKKGHPGTGFYRRGTSM
jgi:hypothetical protein